MQARGFLLGSACGLALGLALSFALAQPNTGGGTGGGPITPTGKPCTGAYCSASAPLSGALGGTGIANSGKTITLGGALATSGAFGLTLTLGGTTNLTLPTSGTILSNALTSAHLLVGSAGNVATDVPLSGVCSITNAGAISCSSLAPLASPTFTGTVTFPDSSVHTSTGLRGLPAVVLSGASSLTYGGIAPALQANSTTTAASAVGLATWAASAVGPALLMYKSRGASVGTAGAIQNNDSIGKVQFFGDDGVITSAPGPVIQALASGNWSSGNTPGALAFSVTTAAGALQERLRINSDGTLTNNFGGITLITGLGVVYGKGNAGVDCPSGITAGTVVVSGGIVTHC